MGRRYLKKRKQGRYSHDNGNENTIHDPPTGIYWVEDKFYGPQYYEKITPELKTRLHNVCHNEQGGGTARQTQNISVLKLRVAKLEAKRGPPRTISRPVFGWSLISQLIIQTFYK